MLFENLLISNRFSMVFTAIIINLSLIKVTQKQVVDFFKHNNSITNMILKDCHVTRNSIDAMQLSCIQYLLQFGAICCSFEHSALIK